MPTDETPADRLRTAAARIRDHFGRRKLIDPDGNVCALGAILAVQGPFTKLCGTMTMLCDDPVADRAMRALHGQLVDLAVDGDLDLLPELLLPGYAVAAIEHWNDKVAADGPAAAAVMEKAAARWEETAGV